MWPSSREACLGSCQTCGTAKHCIRHYEALPVAASCLSSGAPCCITSTTRRSLTHWAASTHCSRTSCTRPPRPSRCRPGRASTCLVRWSNHRLTHSPYTCCTRVLGRRALARSLPSLSSSSLSPAPEGAGAAPGATPLVYPVRLRTPCCCGGLRPTPAPRGRPAGAAFPRGGGGLAGAPVPGRALTERSVSATIWGSPDTGQEGGQWITSFPADGEQGSGALEEAAYIQCGMWHTHTHTQREREDNGTKKKNMNGMYCPLSFLIVCRPLSTARCAFRIDDPPFPIVHCPLPYRLPPIAHSPLSTAWCLFPSSTAHYLLPIVEHDRHAKMRLCGAADGHRDVNMGVDVRMDVDGSIIARQSGPPKCTALATDLPPSGPAGLSGSPGASP